MSVKRWSSGERQAVSAGIERAAERARRAQQRAAGLFMLVRMLRGTTGDAYAFRAAMRAASAHVDPRVPLTDLALPTGKRSRLGERLDPSPLCEPLHGRGCRRSSMYSIRYRVGVSVRVRSCADSTAYTVLTALNVGILPPRSYILCAVRYGPTSNRFLQGGPRATRLCAPPFSRTRTPTRHALRPVMSSQFSSLTGHLYECHRPLTEQRACVEAKVCTVAHAPA